MSEFWDKPGIPTGTKPMEQVLEEYAAEHPDLDLSDKMTWHYFVDRYKKIRSDEPYF